MCSPATKTTVRAHNLVKRFGLITAVDGISFAVQQGECFGFLGPNGAGKTTAMRMISCLSPVTAGSLEVLSCSVQTMPRQIKRRLGLVPQEDNLDEHLSVEENLDIYGGFFGLSKAERERRTQDLLAFLQLAERKPSLVRHLSGGMRRRLLVARALISDPDLLILDEPTTGLDPQVRHLLWEKLRLLKAQARTLLLTTHYMDEAEQLCDRILVMDHGRIIAQGSPRQLIREHTSSEVIEIFGAPQHLAELAGRFQAAKLEQEVLQDRLLLYVDDAEAVVSQVLADKVGLVEVMARRSTLEDVFLRLTGRSLSD